MLWLSFALLQSAEGIKKLSWQEIFSTEKLHIYILYKKLRRSLLKI